MKWKEVKMIYPDQWVVMEALKANTTQDNIRHIEEVSIIDKCSDGEKAMTIYRQYHQKYPSKEYYFAHTSKKDLEIPERKWLGIRC